MALLHVLLLTTTHSAVILHILVMKHMTGIFELGRDDFVSECCQKQAEKLLENSVGF